MVRNRTPHLTLAWLYARDIAAALGVSRPTACAMIRRIPGAEMLYRYENRKGERWRVSAEDFGKWRSAQCAA